MSAEPAPSAQPNGTHHEYAPETVDAIKAAPQDSHGPAMHELRTVPEAATQAPVNVTRTNGVLGVGNEHDSTTTATTNGTATADLLVGPLLNYRRMSKEHTESPLWHGSVLIVTNPGVSVPELRLRIVRSEQDDIVTGSASFTQSIRGEKLYEDPKGAFWAYAIEIPFQAKEATWEYSIEGLRNKSHNDTDPSSPRQFYVPAKSESMRIMFHSCNGFSVGTDEEFWSGPALWNDVLRVHAKRPIHIMLGGGDQIYNDGVRVGGPLKGWTDIANPHKRREFPFNEALRDECDKYYFDNYVKWYGSAAFAVANAIIPQLNIWDDHDIIDGFGSYTDRFMRSHVFRGIGGVAHKYYLLFQHHLPPPKSTYTTDAPGTLKAGKDMTTGTDAVQLQKSWVKVIEQEDPSYIIGRKPGPYVEEASRNIYAQLGARIAFVGIDARTERTRHQINYPETYDLIFDRVSKEIAASNGKLKHLILLLGVPIAYPRLAWLENILRSPLIGPLRLLNKRFGVAGGFFNHFDGSVDLLDDLDDHYTARQHKGERKELIQRLQELSKAYDIRVTILGGDVHLAALGRFYSHPKLKIAAENDWRYMPNIISSAITNKPPPQAVANLLARRNKIHHLDHDTDETLLNLFDVDPAKDKKGVKNKAADSNHCTMPSRNYALIAESNAGLSSSSSPSGAAVVTNGTTATSEAPPPPTTTNGLPNGTSGGVGGGADVAPSAPDGTKAFARPTNPRSPLHAGESDCGASHPAADPDFKPTGLGGDYGLDVAIRVEIDNSDKEGRTKGYGFAIPALRVSS